MTVRMQWLVLILAALAIAYIASNHAALWSAYWTLERWW